MVCLASSYKCEGRCYAGKELLGDQVGDWLRPVSTSPTGEISLEQGRYADGTLPKPLDIIEIPMLRAAARHHQTENHLIDAAASWAKVGEFNPRGLSQLQDHPPALWLNTDHTQKGCNDCLSKTEAWGFQHSLAFIAPADLNIEVVSRPWKNNKICRATFQYNLARYNLSLTDPAVIGAFSSKDEGAYPLTGGYICVSLTQPYELDGRCHKLVASVIEHE